MMNLLQERQSIGYIKKKKFSVQKIARDKPKVKSSQKTAIFDYANTRNGQQLQIMCSRESNLSETDDLAILP